MDNQNFYNQGSAYSPYSEVQSSSYAPRSDLHSNATYHKQTESKGQGILFHQNLMNPDYDDEGMAVNASLKKQTCSYLFALWIDLLVSIMALVYSSTQVSQFLIAINIYNVISACFTLLMLVTIIYGLVVSCGKRQEKQGFFISLMQLSVAVLVLDLPLLFIFGDSTSLNLRIGAILASSIVLHIAKKY